MIAAGFMVFIFGIVFNMADGVGVFAIFTAISVMLALTRLLTKRCKIIISAYSKEPLIIDFQNRNEDQIRAFSDRIIDKAREYIVNKHSRVDRDLPIENQLESIAFLRNNDLIDEARFIELKNILIGIGKNKKPIGFEP